jgi:hypothetical protein
MKLFKLALVTGIAVLAAFPFWAFAQADLSAMESGIASIRTEILGQIDAWNTTAANIEDAQAATAGIDTYQTSYDLLIQAKAQINAYSERLNGYLKDALEYKAGHPEAPAEELDRIMRAADSIDSIMLLIDGMLLRVQGIEATQAMILGKQAGAPEKIEPEYHSSGDVSVLTGDGTYTDYDRQHAYLRQTYKASDGIYYTFFEEYDDDHSFIDLKRWELGATQSFPNFFKGELNLRQRYQDYEDFGFTNGSRKQLILHADYTKDFNKDRTQAQWKYDYKSKNFDQPISRSYLYHFTELNLTHEISNKATGYAFWNMMDYHYSQGDANGNNTTNLGVEFEFVPNSLWTWNTAYTTTERSYDKLKGNAYFDDKFELGARFQPDEISFGEGAFEWKARDQRLSTTTDFDERRLKLRYWRELCAGLDGDFNLEWRTKDYSAANANSFDYWRWRMIFNYSPDYRSRWYYNFDFYDYDYQGNIRTYNRYYNRVGFNYNWDNGVALTTELGLTDQNYSINTGRNYLLWDFLADIYWPFEDHQNLRCYFDWSDLNQTQAGSLNDYTAYALGLDYNWRIDQNYRLTLAYDYTLRDYTNQPQVEDQTLEARIHFDF